MTTDNGDAEHAHVELILAIAAENDRGRYTPCQLSRDDWIGDDQERRGEAAAACHWCFAIDACRTYRDASRDRHSVLAGVDPLARPKPIALTKENV